MPSLKFKGLNHLLKKKKKKRVAMGFMASSDVTVRSMKLSVRLRHDRTTNLTLA